MLNRLVLTSIFLCLASSSPLFAKKKVAFDATPFAGYRQDNVRWTTQYGDTLKWKNLEGIGYGVATKTTLRDRYFMNADIGFANFFSGSMNDSNYLAAPMSGNPANNSMSVNNAFAFRPNLAFGMKIKTLKWLDIMPMIGIDYNRLKVSGKANAATALSSLSNTLQFYGPYVGFDSKTKFTRRWSMNAGAAFRYAFYHGSGNWKFQRNLTNNTMRQAGNGFGIQGQIGLKYLLVPTVSIGGEADVNWNRVKNGHDTRHYANNVKNKTNLNNLNWTTLAGRVTLTKSF
ncbi:MAG TPA: hypothetical protein VMW10_01720 [Alphaproteobacteria bacterium]|nr:hypothetical protein [Alphaproteobacteria bacterium]